MLLFVLISTSSVLFVILWQCWQRSTPRLLAFWYQRIVLRIVVRLLTLGVPVSVVGGSLSDYWCFCIGDGGLWLLVFLYPMTVLTVTSESDSHVSSCTCVPCEFMHLCFAVIQSSWFTWYLSITSPTRYFMNLGVPVGLFYDNVDRVHSLTLGSSGILRQCCQESTPWLLVFRYSMTVLTESTHWHDSFVRTSPPDC